MDADHLLHGHDHHGVFAQVALQDLQGGNVSEKGEYRSGNYNCTGEIHDQP